MRLNGLSTRAHELAGRAGDYAQTAAGRVERARPRVPALDRALSAHERDRRVGGSLLAGALAFRLFVSLLPFALLVVALLGFAESEDSSTPREIASGIGMSKATLSSIANSAKLSQGAQLSVIAFALFALAIASVSAVRALRTVHALAWGLPLRRFQRTVSAAAAFIGWSTLFFGLWAIGGWSRASLGAAGLPLTIALLGGFFLLWLAVSRELPHPEGLSWRAFLPGAALVAAGMEAIHLATVLYFSHKAEQASASYGALGAALVLLLWLYLLGRLIVASAFLNAAVWEQASGGPPASPSPAGPARDGSTDALGDDPAPEGTARISRH
jgi:uncharacterized BrkB/YihY/UPF0761 family membrane protein